MKQVGMGDVMNTDVTVIVVSYNTEKLIPKMMDALNESTGSLNKQVIFIDNASRDDSVALLRSEYAEYTLIENTVNVGFGRANNQAIPLVKGRYMLLLNTDAFVEPDTLRKTISYMDAHPHCGILGVKLIGRDGVLQPSCRYFPTPFNVFLTRTGLGKFFPWIKMVDDMNWDHASTRECDWAPGCYLLIRREVVDQVGLFDERYFLYSEEVDLCYAAKKAGWKVNYYADTTVVHLGGESAKSDADITQSGRQIQALQIESDLLYFRKNHGLLQMMMHVVLQSLADIYISMKGWIKPGEHQHCLAHAKEYWILMFRTRFGTQPTR